jgi:hypothetical protein
MNNNYKALEIDKKYGPEKLSQACRDKVCVNYLYKGVVCVNIMFLKINEYLILRANAQKISYPTKYSYESENLEPGVVSE